MTTPHSARTATACRIVGIDRQKLTDAIANGDYPCAPPTSAGVARVFSTPDLIALYTFARLTEDQWPARIAGKFASHIHDYLQYDADATHVSITKPDMGSATISSTDLDHMKHTHVSGRPIRWHMTFDLRQARANVENGLAEEAGIVGEE